MLCMWGLVSNEGVCVCCTDEVGVGGQVTVRKLWYSYSSTPRGDCGVWVTECVSPGLSYADVASLRFYDVQTEPVSLITQRSAICVTGSSPRLDEGH